MIFIQTAKYALRDEGLYLKTATPESVRLGELTLLYPHPPRGDMGKRKMPSPQNPLLPVVDRRAGLKGTGVGELALYPHQLSHSGEQAPVPRLGKAVVLPWWCGCK